MMTRSLHSRIRQFKQFLWRFMLDHKQSNALELERPAKILFDQKEDLIGDMLVNTVAFRAIKNAYPRWTIHVLAGAANREVVSSNPDIDKIIPFAGLWRTIKSLRHEHYDIYYFHKNRLTLQDFILLKYAGAKVNIGRDKADFKLFDYSIVAPSETEVERFARLLELLGVNEIDRSYQFHLTPEELSRGASHIATLSGRPVIAFNRYGNHRGKLFSRSRAVQLIREINRVYKGAAIVLLCSPATRHETIGMQGELALDNVLAAAWIRTIRDSAAILRHVDLVVTPDTSIVHIACAFHKPQICVYRDQTELQLWRPMSGQAIILLPRSPSRQVDDLDLTEFARALEKARAWVSFQPTE